MYHSAIDIAGINKFRRRYGHQIGHTLRVALLTQAIDGCVTNKIRTLIKEDIEIQIFFSVTTLGWWKNDNIQ